MKNNHYKFILRGIHLLIVVYLVFAIFYIYYCAIRRTTDLLLDIFIVSLFAEGIVIYLNHGNCPFGYIQKKVGDSTPFFELILPKKYAKRAVRFFGLVTILGIVFLDMRLLL